MLVLLLFTGALIGCQNEKIKSSEEIFSVLPKNLECGDISVKAPFFSEFKLHNQTKDSVWVDTIEVSCECVKILQYDSIISPYSEGNLKIELETTDLEGDFERKIFVSYHSSSLEPKVKILRISGKGIKE